MLRYYIGRLPASLVGAAFLAVETWFNHEYMQHSPSRAMYWLCILTPIAGAVGLATSIRFWIDGSRRQAAFLFLFTLLAMTVSFGVAMGRSGHVTDVAQHGRQKDAIAIEDARQTQKEAEGERKIALSEVAENCDHPQAKKCRDAHARLDSVNRRLEAARTKKEDSGGIAEDDSFAKRLAAYVPLSEDQIRLYWPTLQALLTVLGSVAFWMPGTPPDNRLKTKVVEPIVVQETLSVSLPKQRGLDTKRKEKNRKRMKAKRAQDRAQKSAQERAQKRAHLKLVHKHET